MDLRKEVSPQGCPLDTLHPSHRLRIAACAFVSLGQGEFPESRAQVSGAQGRRQVRLAWCSLGEPCSLGGVCVFPAAGAHLGAWNSLAAKAGWMDLGLRSVRG